MPLETVWGAETTHASKLLEREPIGFPVGLDVRKKSLQGSMLVYVTI
jgi:hypothetical protein